MKIFTQYNKGIISIKDKTAQLNINKSDFTKQFNLPGEISDSEIIDFLKDINNLNKLREYFLKKLRKK